MRKVIVPFVAVAVAAIALAACMLALFFSTSTTTTTTKISAECSRGQHEVTRITDAAITVECVNDR